MMQYLYLLMLNIIAEERGTYKGSFNFHLIEFEIIYSNHWTLDTKIPKTVIPDEEHVARNSGSSIQLGGD